MLTGARQTGKTTLAKAKYPELRYVNLDAPENREMLRKISTPAWAASVGNAVLDEAQKEPVVFEKVKYAYDDKGISFSLILGSSQILLLKKIRESLAGRVAIFELWPLLMSEIHAEDYARELKSPLLDRLLTEENVEDVLRKAPPLFLDKEDSRAHDAEDYMLRWGGMPALLTLSGEERWKWLRDYEYTYLERDLSDLTRLDDLEPFTKFQRLSALRSGRLLNYSELARDASVSVDTARRYMEYLRLSYQITLLQPYYKNITSSVIKTPKLYLLDVGLLRQLSGQRGELSGEIYETMVVNEIFKWIKTAQRNVDMFFYRTRSRLELDLLLKSEKGFVGIEIKSRDSVVPSDIRAMKEIASALKKRWLGGLVVYRGDEIRKLSEPMIWAVPSRRLFI
ncbi:MAG: ATP-binding protein [Candidatus Eisenbacteria bacterium]|nr:ATP-binding protein [Candidatus Eisenbacteria bacterium]